MEPVLAMVDRVADSDVTVLLRGESGVGKEVIARELHRKSRRRTKPFVKVNCAALPTELLESELFGHERGAFTGAGTTRIGKFEFAQNGTILLDEISEMPAALQAKLLHVLQDRQFARLGSNRPVEVDVRVLAATNQHLEAMMRAGTFREDLYYRLQVIELHIPALRDRREEIPALAEFFLGKYAKVYRRPPVRSSRTLREALVEYPWPGNIRELENMMKRFVVLQDEQYILAELARLMRAKQVPVAAGVAAASAPAPVAPAPALAPDPEPTSTDEDDEPIEGGIVDGEATVDLQAMVKVAAIRVEREAIEQALVRFRWNRRKAARYLNVSYKTLLNKMKECGINDPATT
jgi:two-component system response regulator AtoC